MSLLFSCFQFEEQIHLILGEISRLLSLVLWVLSSTASSSIYYHLNVILTRAKLEIRRGYFLLLYPLLLFLDLNFNVFPLPLNCAAFILFKHPSSHLTSAVLFVQAVEEFLSEVRGRELPHSAGLVSQPTAVKFLMARKFDVSRAIDLFQAYKVLLNRDQRF